MKLDVKKYKAKKEVKMQVEDSRRDLYVPPRSKRGYKSNSNYERFLYKYENIENKIEDFNSLDLVYYFREVAKECGYKYTIANIKKDASIMKRLLQNYTIREVCGMIAFLYTSEQDYLDRMRLTPSVLASNWVNTIYADYILWLDDKYVPKSKQGSKSVIKHEWNKNSEDTSSIGEW